MFNNPIPNVGSQAWHRYSGKGFSIFASLGKQIRIGVLSVATLATVSPVMAEEHAKASDLRSAGEEKELDEVTISGTMAPLTQLQAVRPVSVITRAEIEQSGAQSVNDLLKLCSAVDVRQRGGFGIQTDISVDGGTYEQVTILLNGVNINNPHTGHLGADLPVGVQDIERIEVLQGAASRVYGGQAFGGAINIVTKQDHKPTLQLGAEAGSYGSFQGGGRLALQHDRVRHHLSGLGGRSDGGTLNDAWKRGSLFYQGAYEGQEADLNWQFGFSRKEYGANTFYSGSSNDQWEQNERYIISVGGASKGKLHLTPNAYWIRTYDNYQWHKGTPNNSHQSDVYGLSLRSHIDWAAGTTALSAEVRQESILSSALGTLMDSTDFMKAHGADKLYTKRANRTNISYTLEHNVVLSQWTLSMGVLANRNTSVGHRFRFYPGADVAYRPSSQWKLTLGYNMGFRLPSFTDLYYNSPDITGNSQLKPEENHSVALSAAYMPVTGLKGSVRLFYSHGRNMIDYVKTRFGDAAHADNFTLDNMGVGTQWDLSFPALTGRDTWLRSLGVSYNYIHQERKSDYEIFTSLYADDYLRHKFCATLHHRIFSALEATWSVRYQQRNGSYQVYDGLTATDQLCDYTPYATLDLKLQWTKPTYDIWVNGTNLTNNKFQDLGNIPQPGLWIMAGARLKLNL